MRRLISYAVASFLFLLFCQTAVAHSMYQSSVLLDYRSSAVEVELQLPASRLAQVTDLTVNAQTLQALQSKLDSYILRRVHLRSSVQAEWREELIRPVSWQIIDGAPYVIARLRFTPIAGVAARHFTLYYDVITDTLASHVALVTVRSDWNNGTFANEPELLGVLSGDSRSIEIDRGSGSWTKGFASVFHLGIRHIAEGTDHLLFLLALLLPAPLLYRSHRWAEFAGVRHGFTQILTVVTAFTIGHSVSLALAASGVIHVPGRPIELLIAISILVSALHAIRPIFPGREAYIAGAFGLIHGLAFASTLADLGLQRWERVESILSFNFGIEAMQLGVVLCVMPSLMLLSLTAQYTPFRWAGAMLAVLAACGWTVERSTGHSLGVDGVVDELAKHSVALALGLFSISLIAFVRAHRSTQTHVRL